MAGFGVSERLGVDADVAGDVEGEVEGEVAC